MKRWIRRLKRLVKDMPPNVWVYVSGGVNVMALGKDGEHFMTEFGGVDQESMIDSASGGDWDGGGW